MGARDMYQGQPDPKDKIEEDLMKIWWRLYNLAATGITAVVSEASVTPHFEDLTAGQSQVIPVGAKGYAWWVFTGTATVAGKAVPAGAAGGDNNTLLATVTVAMDTPGTGLVSWNT